MTLCNCATLARFGRVQEYGSTQLQSQAVGYSTGILKWCSRLRYRRGQIMSELSDAACELAEKGADDVRG